MEMSVTLSQFSQVLYSFLVILLVFVCTETFNGRFVGIIRAWEHDMKEIMGEMWGLWDIHLLFFLLFLALCLSVMNSSFFVFK